MMRFSNVLLSFILILFVSTQSYAQSCEDGDIAACACEAAQVLCSLDEVDGFVLQMSNEGRPEDGPTPICPNTATATHNPNWIAFTAWCEDMTLDATFADCQDNGVFSATGGQLAVYTDCSFSEVQVCNATTNYCNIPSQTLSMSNLEVGQVYYILIDGCNGVTCEVTFSVVGDCGVEEIAPWSDRSIRGENIVCVGDVVNYEVERLPGARQYFWFMDGGLYEEVEDNRLTIEWTDPGEIELCVDVANEPCVPIDTQPDQICQTIIVVEPDAGQIDLSQESACLGIPIEINILAHNDQPQMGQMIIITDSDGIILEIIDGTSFTWTPTYEGDFVIYSVNYTLNSFFPPAIGGNINGTGCADACCIMEMLEFPVGSPVIALNNTIDIDCTNASGTINTSASEGDPPYRFTVDGMTFQNSGSFTGLTAGSYTVIVEDFNGCPDQLMVEITEDIPVLIDNVQPTPSTCEQANGRVTVNSSASNVRYSINGGTSFQTSSVFTGLAAGNYTITAANNEGCVETTTVEVTNIASPDVAVSNQINLDCNTPTGTVTVNGSGGTPPYQYSIDGTNYQNSNTFSGLAVGGYTIRVRDANSCMDNVSTTITETIIVLIDNIQAGPTTCNDPNGTITVNSSANGVRYSINGGAYQASNVFNGLAPGNYTIGVIDENNCTTTQVTAVGSITPPDVQVNNQIDIDCNTPAGTITLSASAGSTPYQYSMDGTNFQAGATFGGLAAGSHTAWVRDVNGCLDMVAFTIAENIPVLIDEIQPTSSTCGSTNGTITVVSSANGVRYSLDGGAYQASNVFTDLGSGNYTIGVIDENNCTTTQMVAVTNIGGPAIALDNQINLDCNTPAGTITVSGNAGTAPYEYSMDGTNFSPSGTFADLPVGNYTMWVRDANSCTDILSTEVTETITILIDEIQTTPAPCEQASGTITISSSAIGTEFSIDGSPFQTSNTFAGLVTGSYTIDVRDENNCTTSEVVEVGFVVGPDIALESQINLDCNTPSGTVALSANSGTGPYEYSIDGANYQSEPTFDGLAVGDYTFTVRDANNCTSSVPTTITETIIILIDEVETIAATCNDASGTITVNSSAIGTLFSIDGGPMQPENTFEGLIAGTYTIGVIDENGCTISEQVTIDNEATPAIALDNQIDIDCNIPAGTIEVSASSGATPYEYSIDGNNFQSESIFTDLEIGNYQITVRDANNCIDVVPVEITETVTVLIDDVATVPANCNQADGVISVNSSVTGATYSINGGPFQPSPDFNGLEAGSYTIVVADENDYCTTSQIVPLDNLNGPELSLDNQIDVDCNIPTGSITVSAGAGTPPFQYSIDGTNFQAEPVFTDLMPGDYAVIVQDGNQCTAGVAVEITETITVLVDDIETIPSTCDEANGSITVNSSVAGATFSLNGGPFQTSNVFTNLTGGDYTIEVADANDYCMTMESASVASFTSPVIALENQINIDCVTPSGTVEVSNSAGTAPFEYSMDGTNFQASNTFTDLSVGNYTFYVRDANACFDQVSLEITETITILVDNIEVNAATCNDANGSITITSSANGVRFGLNGGSLQSNNTFTGLNEGEYTIEIVDEVGCATTRTASMVNLGSPTIALDQQVDIDCTTAAGHVEVSASGGTEPYTYTMDGEDYGDVSIFRDLAAGSYDIQVSDANTCLDDLTVDVDDNTPTLIENVEAVSTNCGEDDGVISIRATGSALQYTLDGTNFQSAADFYDMPAGTYTVQVVDDMGCSETQTIEVPASDAVEIPTVQVTNTTCGLDNGVLTFVQSTTQDLQYSISNQPYQAINVYPNLTPGDYEIFIINGEDCEGATQVNIEPSEPLIIEETNTTRSSCGANDGRIDIRTNADFKIAAYYLNGELAGDELVGLAPDMYSVLVVDVDGCSDSTMVNVAKEKCNIFVPNAFSPNNDGANDFFEIVIPLHFNISIESFAVYDRWGNPMYEDYPPNGEASMSWDGTVNGKPANMGVYVYTMIYIDENDRKQVLAGDVMLMR